MIEFLNNFHFLRPALLLLIFIPIFFYRRYWQGMNNQSSWEKICDKKLLKFLLVKGSSQQRKLIAWLVMIALFCAILAAAGPSWKKIEVPSLEQENPLMILLNLSSDMQENDLTPSRLERAKYKIKDLLLLLQGGQVGLEVYSAEPFLISPLTDDAQILINLLPAINFDIMPTNGDRLDRAIAMAVDKFKNAGYYKGNLLIFTPDVGQRFDLAMVQAENAAKLGYAVNIINVSNKNNQKLELLAQKSGGSYDLLLASDSDIQKIVKKMAGNKSGELKKSENLQSVWLDYGYYLTFIPLLCCLYLFRRGIVVILLLLGFSANAEASFFANANQDGLKAFNEQDYQRAAENFENPDWRAAANYRMGNYQKALQYYQNSQDDEALYNQGNALAKDGKIEEAIKKYEEVLQLKPSDEDAKFNLEYLKQQQQNQQRQDKKQDQDEDKKKEQQQQEQQEQQQDSSKSDDGEDSKQQKQQSSQEEQNSGQKPQSGDEEKNEPAPEQMKEENQPQEKTDKLNEQEAQQSGQINAEKGSPEQEYDEKVQAKAQQYREIPEDVGGLLKAFIRKEYNLNRYDDK